jgi:crossover junction endodeoxyribonuclease RuvC
MIFCGIDPGKQGAIAKLCTDSDSLYIQPMPDTMSGVLLALKSCQDASFVAIEKPFFPPRIGIKHATTIAQNYGVLLAGLTDLQVSFEQIPPAKWKKNLSLSSDKEASRQRANELFPIYTHYWKLKKNDGLAEAALLAYWAKIRSKI